MGDKASYTAAHRRLYAVKGRASDHDCVSCEAPATQWAYLHGDPEEKTCPRTGLAYSLNHDYYQPMCHSCHRLFDKMHRRSRKAEAEASTQPERLAAIPTQPSNDSQSGEQPQEM